VAKKTAIKTARKVAKKSEKPVEDAFKSALFGHDASTLTTINPYRPTLIAA